MKDYSKYFKKPSLLEEAKRSKERVSINKDGLVVDEVSKQIGKNKKYFIRTYGCQGNEADGETARQLFENG